jgi:predicted ATP-grasp superfamily ATP-dependent carboligase
MKPRFGAGSQATFLVRNVDDLAQTWSPAFHECPDAEFVVQSHVHGQPASVALLLGRDQTIALAPGWQRLSSDGRFHYRGGSLPLPASLAQRAKNLARQAIAGIDGLQGYVGVDLVLGDDGVDFAIEINPRLTTSYLGLRQLSQQNLADLIVKTVRGEHVSPVDWAKGEVRFGIDSSEQIF